MTTNAITGSWRGAIHFSLVSGSPGGRHARAQKRRDLDLYVARFDGA